jgi:hypothetical protein
VHACPDADGPPSLGSSAATSSRCRLSASPAGALTPFTQTDAIPFLQGAWYAFDPNATVALSIGAGFVEGTQFTRELKSAAGLVTVMGERCHPRISTHCHAHATIVSLFVLGILSAICCTTCGAWYI